MNLLYDNVIFDADGTVLDTFKGVRECIVHALESLKKTVPSDDVLKGFVGPSLMDSFQTITFLTLDEAKSAVAFYREKYAAGAVFDCTLFEGYPLLFKKLKECGVTLSVASSKPQKYLNLIFDKHNISQYFDKIIGPDFDASASDKAELVKKARICERAIMVGDRKFDIIAANTVGIDSIGAAYGGFTPAGEFDEYKPTFIVDKAIDIFDIIIKEK